MIYYWNVLITFYSIIFDSSSIKLPFMNISDSIISILNILTRKWVIWKKSIHKGGIKTCLDIRLEALKVIHRQNVFVKYFKGNWKLLIEAWKTNMQKYSLFAIFFTNSFLYLASFMLITSYFKGNFRRKINIWQLKDIWFTSIQIHVI